MAKTRVGVLLKEKVGKPSSNQSADLISLAQKYQVWCKKIRSLVVSLERHYQAIGHMQATRTQVRANYAFFPLLEWPYLLISPYYATTFHFRRRWP
jgi:hypothetical protein